MRMSTWQLNLLILHLPAFYPLTPILTPHNHLLPTPYPKRFKCDYLPTAEFYTYISTICHIYVGIYVYIYVTYMSTLM